MLYGAGFASRVLGLQLSGQPLVLCRIQASRLNEFLMSHYEPELFVEVFRNLK